MKMKCINNNSFIYFFLYPVANTPTRELLIKNNQTQPQSFHAMNTFFSQLCITSGFECNSSYQSSGDNVMTVVSATTAIAL